MLMECVTDESRTSVTCAIRAASGEAISKAWP